MYVGPLHSINSLSHDKGLTSFIAIKDEIDICRVLEADSKCPGFRHIDRIWNQSDRG